MEKEIGIIGAGSWGIALGYLLKNNGHNITIWSRRQETVDKLRAYHGNEDKLPGVILDDSVKFTCSMEEAIKDKDIIVLVVPSSHMRETVRQMEENIKYNKKKKK